jgi:hypothetical protein
MFLVNLKISFSSNNSEPYHLVPFLLDVTFTTYVALLKLSLILHTLKQTQPSVASPHLASHPHTDSHWEVKLAGLGKPDGQSCIDWSANKSISTLLATHHQLRIFKTFVLSLHFKT